MMVCFADSSILLNIYQAEYAYRIYDCHVKPSVGFLVHMHRVIGENPFWVSLVS